MADNTKTTNTASTAFFTAGVDGARFTAQQLFAASPEFAATNAHTPQPGLKRPPARAPSDGTKSGRKSKAVVMVWLAGGADSFNLLMPHDGCTPSTTSPDKSILEQYPEVRGVVTIAKSSMKQIDTVASSPGLSAGQPCSSFGMHPEFSNLQSMYNDGEWEGEV